MNKLCFGCRLLLTTVKLLELYPTAPVRDMEVDVCAGCKGIWLDREELKAIQQENIYTLLFKAFGWIIKVKSGNL